MGQGGAKTAPVAGWVVVASMTSIRNISMARKRLQKSTENTVCEWQGDNVDNGINVISPNHKFSSPYPISVPHE